MCWARGNIIARPPIYRRHLVQSLWIIMSSVEFGLHWCELQFREYTHRLSFIFDAQFVFSFIFFLYLIYLLLCIIKLHRSKSKCTQRIPCQGQSVEQQPKNSVAMRKKECGAHCVKNIQWTDGQKIKIAFKFTHCDYFVHLNLNCKIVFLLIVAFIKKDYFFKNADNLWHFIW